MRLIRTDVPIEDLEAAQTHLGESGSIVEDDDLDTARQNLRDAIAAITDGDGSYQDRLENAVTYVHYTQRALDEFGERAQRLYLDGHLRIGNASAAAVLASVRVSNGALGDWLAWANREIESLE